MLRKPNFDSGKGKCISDQLWPQQHHKLLMQPCQNGDLIVQGSYWDRLYSEDGDGQRRVECSQEGIGIAVEITTISCSLCPICWYGAAHSCTSYFVGIGSSGTIAVSRTHPRTREQKTPEATMLMHARYSRCYFGGTATWVCISDRIWLSV